MGGRNDDRYAIITGLTNGTTYTLRVTAVSLLGPGASDTTTGAPTTVLRVPGEPTDLVLTAVEGGILLKWTPPRDLGNPPFTAYTVQYRVVGETDWTTATGAPAADATTFTPRRDGPGSLPGAAGGGQHPGHDVHPRRQTRMGSRPSPWCVRRASPGSWGCIPMTGASK